MNWKNFDDALRSHLRCHHNNHSYGTRGGSDIIVNRFCRTKTLASLRYSGIKIWNAIPADVRNSNSCDMFKLRYIEMFCWNLRLDILLAVVYLADILDTSL